MFSQRLSLNAIALAVILYCAVPAMADDKLVTLSQTTAVELQPGMTKILKVDRPFQVMVLGNPNVANTSAINLSLIAITGKGAGMTNLVLFDQEGQEISTTTIQVVPASDFIAGEHVITRHEVRVMGFDTKGREPDRRYLCGRNCGEIDVDGPTELNPPGNTSQRIGTTTSRTSVGLPTIAPQAPGGQAPGGQAPGGQAPAAPSGQY